MRNDTRKHSRPKTAIEPIHVGELLRGAGMTGYLSVLEPPVLTPHLRELAGKATPATGLARWFTDRADSLFRGLRGQQEALAEIAEVARRTNGRVEKLHRYAERIAKQLAPPAGCASRKARNAGDDED